MHKKNFFYISLIIIYILYLTKDNLFALTSNLESLNNFTSDIKESYYETEYQKLSNILKINPSSFNIEYSKVMLQNIYDFYNKITINKGTNSNIEKGQAVINEKGLIGIINKVSNNSSEVNLITNPNTSISVKVNNSYGILTTKDNKLIVKNIKTNNEIKEGEQVFTSGLTDIPEGILVGTVKSVTKSSLELEYILEITSAIDIYNLSYVGVVLP
ncbi:MAG: rod shape-determining protein MreC [Bacilli bacterium]|jgi:rod shape-determining protein MreC|nr:rod shape-determining protein MreC [Bacilli bacterium]